MKLQFKFHFTGKLRILSYKLYLKLPLDADIMFMYLKYHIFNDQCYSIMSRAIMAFDHVHLKLSLSNDGLIPA